ncbi:prepilin-type N-terminal cleavage/methylation domain-containing protein [Massilia genomosp. 1]|uniref:Type II secretion system protein n=1 Tax=Massilia genomosp. 1 TaxID=2609280 RepID=A0ABX0MRJ9_9BURK|nr:type II secretion system protein [Massilia genomosp. 1]NHZ65371.1 type II secretion system protein [Massilia genomosp. 1]
MYTEPPRLHRPALARQRGISFVELIIFMVIIGVGLAGILSAMNLSTRTSADPLVRKQALMLAEGLMEEVQLARFTFCDATDARVEEAKAPALGGENCASLVENVGNEAGATRPFDNVNDYVAAYGTPSAAFLTAGRLSDAAGQDIALPGYTVMLTVTPTGGLGPAGRQVPQTEALAIRIAVFFNNVESVVLEGYRVRYAPNAPP